MILLKLHVLYVSYVAKLSESVLKRSATTREGILGDPGSSCHRLQDA